MGVPARQIWKILGAGSQPGSVQTGPVPTETLFAALTVLAPCLGINQALVHVGQPLRVRRGGLRPSDTNGVFTISRPDCNPRSRMAAMSATRTAQWLRKLGRYSSAFCGRFVPNLSKIYRYWAEPARRAGLHPQDYDDFEYCPTAPPVQASSQGTANRDAAQHLNGRTWALSSRSRAAQSQR